MSKPNFFIIGAPKCGTTALCEYLRTHPQVFVCEPKEPHYFADDFSCLQYVKEESAYLDLFRDAGPQHLARGEGSVYYLYSDPALNRIKAFQPDARIIVMLRNPVEMLPSYHAQMLYTVVEDVEDFAKAWDLQEDRSHGNSIPRGCIDSKLLDYERWGMLGHRVEQVLTMFPPDHVKLVFFEDFIRDTRSCYLDVLQFLGVQDDGRTVFPAVNERKEHKSRIIGYLLNNRVLIENLSWLRAMLEQVGISATGLKNSIKRLNARKTPRKVLTAEFRQRLTATFTDDIRLLEEISRRDLNHWLSGKE